MKEMNGIEKKRDVMFGMSNTQNHSEGFGGKVGHKIREREEKDRSTYISYSYRFGFGSCCHFNSNCYYDNNLL